MGKQSWSASSADRWMRCPGSVNLCAQVPKPPQNEWAEEGSNAHQLAEMCLVNGKDPLAYVDSELEQFSFGTNTGKTFLVTNDMATAVKVYTDHINELIAGMHTSLYGFERRVVFPFHTTQHSIIDTFAWVPYGVLTLIDYKHGQGHLVEAEENYQMLWYAISLVHELNLTEDDVERISIQICQPRCFDSEQAISEWVLSWDELQKYKSEIYEAYLKTKTDPDVFVPGPEQCKWCPAKAFCPAQNKEVEPVLVGVENQPLALSLDKCAYIASKKSQINDLIKACEDRVQMEMIDFGRAVDGFKIVRKKKYKKFIDEDSAAKTLLQSYPADVIFSQSLKTPTQLIKTLGEGAISPLLQDSIEELTIAPLTDRRRAVIQGEVNGD